MPQIVVAGTTGTIIQCSHKGTAHLPKGDNRLQISDNPAVTAGQEAGVSFAPGSPNVVTPCPYSTSQGPSPCTATLAATAGISTQLMVGGVGVLLDNATGQATNANDPSATWSVLNASQTLLSVDH
jgi:hypothetical protein